MKWVSAPAALLLIGLVRLDAVGQRSSGAGPHEWIALGVEARNDGGTLVVKPGAGWLQYRRALADVTVEAEVRVVGQGARGGVFLRSWPRFSGGTNPTSGYEVVITSDAPARVEDAIVGYGQRVAVTAEPAPPPGPDGWRRYRLECVGDEIRVEVNGQHVALARGVRNPQGHVAFRAERGSLEVRNLRIQEAPEPAPVPPPGVFQIADVTPPRVSREVKPRYTREAMDRRIQGGVWLHVVVGADGVPGDITIVRSLDPEYGLDVEALAAARRWRFRPAMRDGVPVPVIVTLELTFTLK